MGNKSDRMSFHAFDEESENFIVLMNRLKGKQETDLLFPLFCHQGRILEVMATPSGLEPTLIGLQNFPVDLFRTATRF